MTSLHFNDGIKPWFDHHWDSFRVFPRLAAQAAGWNTTGNKNLFEIIKRCKCNDLQKLTLTSSWSRQWCCCCERSRFHHSNDVQTCLSGPWRFGDRFPPTRWPDLCRGWECCRFILWATICSLQLFAISWWRCNHRSFLVTSPSFIPVWLSYKIPPHLTLSAQNKHQRKKHSSDSTETSFKRQKS